MYALILKNTNAKYNFYNLIKIPLEYIFLYLRHKKILDKHFYSYSITIKYFQ